MTHHTHKKMLTFDEVGQSEEKCSASSTGDDDLMVVQERMVTGRASAGIDYWDQKLEREGSSGERHGISSRLTSPTDACSGQSRL